MHHLLILMSVRSKEDCCHNFFGSCYQKIELFYQHQFAVFDGDSDRFKKLVKMQLY